MEVTNHVGSPGDSHYPSCPDSGVCPHCGAPKASPRPYYPYTYPWTQPWWGTTSVPLYPTMITYRTVC